MPRFPMCLGHMDLGVRPRQALFLRSKITSVTGNSSRSLAGRSSRETSCHARPNAGSQDTSPSGRRMHARQVDPVGVRQSRVKKLCPADDESLFDASRLRLAASDRQRFFQRRCAENVRVLRPSSRLPRLTTIESRPSRGLPMASKVFRPMISGWPMVSFRKRRRSLPSRQGSLPPRPMTPFSAIATMRESVNSALAVKPRQAP